MKVEGLVRGCMKKETKRNDKNCYNRLRCGKNCYNRLDAMLTLSRINNKHSNSKRQECRKYWCGVCKAYHLTKMKEYK